MGNTKMSAGSPELSAKNSAAFTAALKLVSRAEQCRAGLLLKLRQRGYSVRDAGAACDKLEESGLVNDERFARLWLQSRIARKTESPRKLSAGLFAKGINGHSVRAGLNAALSPEVEQALLIRYIAETGVHDRAALRAEGFSPEALDTL